MDVGFDRTKCLQELEHDDWGEPTFSSHLVTTCHRLRRKPLSEFSVEDLRILIGQGIGLRFLMPLAIDRLEQEPLVEGDFYPGDLLTAVLRTDESFWAGHPECLKRARTIVRRVKDRAPSLEQPVRESLDNAPALLTME
jgi:hypothetical protein